MINILSNIKKIPFIIPVLYNRHKLRKKYRGPKDLSLITNNCIGGVISHELGLRFFSPCINLWFSNKDFLVFIKYLDYYLNAEIEEFKDNSKKYPIGIIRGNKNAYDILINFMHYKTFEEAKMKWNERKRRISEHVVFIFDAKTLSDEVYEFANICKKNPSCFLITYESLGANKTKLASKFGNISFLNCKPIDGMTYNLNGKRNIERIQYVNYLNNLLAK